MKISQRAQYYGEQNRNLDLGGIILSEYAYHAPDTPWHYHENPYFMYVMEGNMTDINHGGCSLMPLSTLIFHNWQEPHKNEKKSKIAGGFHLELERSWFDNQKLDINLWEGSQIIKDPNLHFILSQIYLEFKRQDQYSELTIEILLLQLCERINTTQITNPKETPAWIGQLKDLLSEDNEHLTLTYLSDQLGIHPVHLSRSIPKYLGFNLGEYLRKQKLNRAFAHLKNPKLSLTEIAHMCGFADQSHFTRMYKSYLGLTPKLARAAILS